MGRRVLDKGAPSATLTTVKNAGDNDAVAEDAITDQIAVPAKIDCEFPSAHATAFVSHQWELAKLSYSLFDLSGRSLGCAWVLVRKPSPQPA